VKAIGLSVDPVDAHAKCVIIVPAVTDEEAKQNFPSGWKALTPYLRLTKQPTAR